MSRIQPPTNHRLNFRINDLVFEVPPTDIRISHRASLFENSHLRSSYATKSKTGNSVAYVAVRLVVLPSEMWRLHRLIQAFNYTPFWEIQNEYVRDVLVPDLDSSISMAVCAEGLSLGTVQDNPDTVTVDLRLAWFNYFPYTSNLGFKQGS